MGYICRYCGGKDLVQKNYINGYGIYLCNSCQILQTKVHNEQIKRTNIDKYNKLYIKNYLEIRKPQLIKDFKISIHEIEKLKHGGNILDVGCGTGIFLETLVNNSRYKWEIKGIDINNNSVSKASLGIRKNILKKSINHTNFKNSYFDVITCYDVLEHSSDINKSLIEIRRVLKNDGILLIQVPNSKSLMCFLTKNDWDWWCVPDHVFHFTKNSITRLLEDKGFHIIMIRTWENPEIFIKNIQGHLKKILPRIFCLNRIIAKFIFFPLYFIWFVSNKINKTYQHGGLIYLLAQKI